MLYELLDMVTGADQRRFWVVTQLLCAAYDREEAVLAIRWLFRNLEKTDQDLWRRSIPDDGLEIAIEVLEYEASLNPAVRVSRHHYPPLEIELAAGT